MADKIVIIVPTEREAAYFASAGLKAEICGVGMAECAASVARLLADTSLAGETPDLVVLAGIAGVCGGGPGSDGLTIGDTVVVENEVIIDLGRVGRDGLFTPLFQKTYTASFVPPGLRTARGHTVNTAGQLVGPSLGEEPGVTIENMEGAAFFSVCERFSVRAMEVRTISNRVGEPVTPAALDIAARRLAEDLKNILCRCA